MSHSPRKSGNTNQSRIVTASVTVTKKQPGSECTRNEQRNRIAEIQSCCGIETEERTGGGPQLTPGQLPRAAFSKCFPLPPECCLQKSGPNQPCSNRSQSSSQRGELISSQQSPQRYSNQNRSLSPPSRSNATANKTSQQKIGSKQASSTCPCSDDAAAKPPSKIENKIKTALMKKSLIKPLTKVTAKARQVTKTPPESIETPAGVEPVLQKAIFEKRIERNEQGEALIKNLIVSKLNDQNEMDYVEMGIQQLEPKFAKMDGKEIVGVTSTVSITPSYAAVSKDYIRALTQDNQDVGMSPEEVARLIEEEKEDIENTLKIIPPDLMLLPGKYEIKQRLQQLRLNSESVALLEQTIIQPEITPDEAQQEPSPEAMATVMHTVEIGITPDVTPDQVFNSLFREPPNENFIHLSSVTPGPLQDVVVPSNIPKEIHKEAVTNEMSKLTEKFNGIQPGDIPHVDVFSEVMSDEQKSPQKGNNKERTFEPINDQKSVWAKADLEHLVNVVGAEPVEVLEPFDLEKLEQEGNLETELANGVQYFIEANPIQYMNRVQLRGSQLPSYFPGYMVAVPDFPDLIKIAKTPDEVFGIAWKSIQAKYFEEDAMMTVSVASS